MRKHNNPHIWLTRHFNASVVQEGNKFVALSPWLAMKHVYLSKKALRYFASHFAFPYTLQELRAEGKTAEQAWSRLFNVTLGRDPFIRTLLKPTADQTPDLTQIYEAIDGDHPLHSHSDPNQLYFDSDIINVSSLHVEPSQRHWHLKPL